MTDRILNIADVASRQLCCGCGACASLAPDRIEMIDVLEHGRRPRYRRPDDAGAADDAALAVCPGLSLEHRRAAENDDLIAELRPGWGPVLEVWEGYAGDDAIRFAGSSGGAATALALAGLEDGPMHGALHIAARDDAPLLNHTVFSTTRTELLAATGSRYAPASPCDGLRLIEQAPAPCVFIGKPCDVVAATKAARLRPALDERLGLTIAIFCAGTPTTRATYRLLEKLGVDDPADVVSVRYRGRGWPGETTVIIRTAAGLERRSLSYREAWGGILSRDRQWRCQVCPDHTGEFADLSIGDPWRRAPRPGEAGSSLILVRTERGRRLLRRAVERGHLIAQRVPASHLADSQPNLLRARGAVWGRLLVCRLLRIPAPHYRGFPIFRFWRSELSLGAKARSILGTFRRIVTRRLTGRVALEPLGAPPARPARSPKFDDEKNAGAEGETAAPRATDHPAAALPTG
ncbi:MAG: Coenzyme F420 hydrogenase/dehydrogenase, beta subunit C-terminal domain [Planctomycetota bacterium]|nr:Coenzyme F420 hydrogenase/dehydrogenase, beta subunit C-terminal domain [Planctomycetota bacterium]